MKMFSRFGVVGNATKLVKDCYIMPLASTEPVPACLLPLDGPGLPVATRSNVLLAILVRTRRKRPGESPIPSAAPAKLAKIAPSPTLSGDGDIGTILPQLKDKTSSE